MKSQEQTGLKGANVLKNKGTLLSLFLLAVVLSTTGCKKTEDTVSADLTPKEDIEAVADAPEKKVERKKVSREMANIEKMSMPKIEWMYDKVGRSTWFYEAQIDSETFTEDEYKQLMKVVYSSSEDDDRIVKHAATYALQYSAFEALENGVVNDTLKDLQPALYSEDFLDAAVQESPSLIGYLPSDLTHYDEISVVAIQHNPFAFDYMPLNKKASDAAVSALFKSKDIFHHGDRSFKKRALEYASINQAVRFAQKDGNILELSPYRLISNPRVVLAAVKQNPNSLRFADEMIQTQVQQEGLGALTKQNAGVSADIIPEKTETQADGTVLTTYEFDSVREVVVEADIVDKIESSFEKPLNNLWRVAKGGNFGDVYIAVFEPIDTHRLGAVILIKPSGDLVSKSYPAVYDPRTPESIWFDRDNGVFAPENFRLLGFSTSKDVSEIELVWVRNEESKPFRFTESGSTFKASELLF